MRRPSLDRDARLDLAATIRQARLATGFTLEALALQLGFANYKPLQLIERGRMAIPPEKIEGLETLLGFPRNGLLWRESRCRLLRLGFDVDRALETEEMAPAGPPADAGPPGDPGRQAAFPAPERSPTMEPLATLTSHSTNLRQEIGQMLRRHRERLHYSQEQVAQAVGFKSKKPVWLLEDGRMAIPADKVLKLAAYLQIDPHDLLLLEARCRLLAAGFDLTAMLEEAGRLDAARPTTPETGDADPASVGGPWQTSGRGIPAGTPRP